MSLLFVCLYCNMAALQVSILGGVTVRCWEWGSLGVISNWRYDILLSKEKKLSVWGVGKFGEVSQK